MKSKHHKAIKCLVDSTEAVLGNLQKNGVDPENVARSKQFQVLVHLLKSIIDGQMEIPNELTDDLVHLSEELDLDKSVQDTIH